MYNQYVVLVNGNSFELESPAFAWLGKKYFCKREKKFCQKKGQFFYKIGEVIGLGDWCLLQSNFFRLIRCWSVFKYGLCELPLRQCCQCFVNLFYSLEWHSFRMPFILGNRNLQILSKQMGAMVQLYYVLPKSL